MSSHICAVYNTLGLLWYESREDHNCLTVIQQRGGKDGTAFAMHGRPGC